MNGSNANNLCSDGGDMLSYLYGEMAAGDRESFELHLADCGTCIDDLAELSQSRYPVFEWKQLEFDPLRTPRVVIPIEIGGESWFDKLRTAISFRPAIAFGAAAAIAIVAFLTVFVLQTGSGGETEVAGAKPTPDTPASVIPQPAVEQLEPYVVPSKPEDSGRDKSNRVQAQVPARKAPVRTVKVKARQTPRRSQPLPTLSSVGEDEDDSLRLADMFEEIGTSE